MKNENFRMNAVKFPFLKKFLCLLSVLAMSAAISLAGTNSLNADDEDAKELIKQAEKLTRKGKVSEAEKILRRAIVQYPNDSPAKLSLAYLLLKRKNLTEAVDLTFPVAQAESENSFAFAILGMIYLNAGNFREAERLLLNSVGLNRREALGWNGLGLLDFYEGRIKLSLEKLRTAVYYEDDEADFIYSLAQVSARAEKYGEAADAYRKFLRISPDNDVERRERIKGLVKFLYYLGGRRSLYNVSGKDNTKVSVSLVNDRPIIEMRVNGKDEPLRFVLDTGSGMTVISDETAERLKIKSVTKGGVARALGGDGKFEIVYGFLRSVEIGDVKIKNVPIYIREFHNQTHKFDGYIGLALISKFLTTIDYGNSTFSLIKKENIEKKETLTAQTETLKLPLRLTTSGFLSGEVLLEGIESSLNFIVDTGASISVISEDVAEIENIKKFESGEKMRVIGAAGITENVPSFMLPKVTFGTHSRKRLKAIALDLDLINEAAGFTQAGILGGNFLKNYSITFDFEKAEVIFVPNEK